MYVRRSPWPLRITWEPSLTPLDSSPLDHIYTALQIIAIGPMEPVDVCLGALLEPLGLGWAGAPTHNQSRDRKSPISGMDFFIPFPFPHFVNRFFSFPSCSKILRMDFFMLFPSLNLGNGFSQSFSIPEFAISYKGVKLEYCRIYSIWNILLSFATEQSFRHMDGQNHAVQPNPNPKMPNF